jgi:hypothetical protein
MNTNEVYRPLREAWQQLCLSACWGLFNDIEYEACVNWWLLEKVNCKANISKQVNVSRLANLLNP